MLYQFLNISLCSQPHWHNQNTTQNTTCSLFSFHKMHINNYSGFNLKHALWRINNRAYKCNQYSTFEKMKILGVIEKMVNDAQLTYAQASNALSIDQLGPSWLQPPQVSDISSLHLGPISIFKVIEVALIAFIAWQVAWEGSPCQPLYSNEKTCSLKPKLSQKSKHAVKISISCFMNKTDLSCIAWPHTKHSGIQARSRPRPSNSLMWLGQYD